MTTYGWTRKRLSNPDVEPVTVEEAAAQCEIDDDLIEAHRSKLAGYIKAARELAESYTKRTFIESRWRISNTDFGPSDASELESTSFEAAIELPMSPVISVSSVTYLDNDGNRQTFTAWDLDENEPPRLWPAFQYAWPWGRCAPGAVQIEYVAGYQSSGSPAGADAVPAVAKQAILLLVGHWFANREDTAAVNLATIPNGFERLLDSIRIYP